MKRRKLLFGLSVFAAVVAVCIFVFIVTKGGNMDKTNPQPTGSFSLTSAAFENGGHIPAKYTCKGDDTSPPLAIAKPPEGTKSFALILHDPDAPAGDWVHWTMWNIPANTTDIASGTVPDSADEGQTSFDKIGYGGPCPPSGTHRYIFELYALDSTLELSPNTTRDQLKSEIDKHALGQTTLTGLFGG